MEGWYVRELLFNKDTIRSNIFIERRESDTLIVDFDDDTYSDLLSVESMFNKLLTSRLLSDKEATVMTMLLADRPANEISRKLQLDIGNVYRTIKEVCAKIAFNLGGHFTNEGFLAQIAERHDLTIDQQNLIRTIMER